MILRNAILDQLTKSKSPQTALQITQGIALQGLIAQELPGLVAAGLVLAGPDGTYTTAAAIAQGIADHEAAIQKLRQAQANAATLTTAPAAPAPAKA